MKTILKFLLLVFATTVAFAMVSALMPYSDSFKEANKTADPSVILYVLAAVSWICLAIVYIVKHSTWEKRKLMFYLTIMLFLVLSFMTQIETLFFRHAFKVLSTADILLIMIANGTVVIAATPLSIALFKGRREQMDETSESRSAAGATHVYAVPNLVAKLTVIGILYMVIYFVFGYFVAWKVSDLRVFYSGQATDNGFIGGLIANVDERPTIFPFQFLRGVLFGLFVLPLMHMFYDQPRTLLISLVLVFSSVGIMLIIPNVLFPDSVRWAHFREMMSSMIIFAVVIWWVYQRLMPLKEKVVRDNSQESGGQTQTV